MGRLTGISFAGVDEKTDISELQRLQTMDPRVEFGILLFENWEEKGNCYHNPGKLERFHGSGLNLCAHLCGSIACAAKRNNWEPAMEFADLSLFTRVQLNLAKFPSIEREELSITLPEPIKEVIIQQNAAYDCGLFYRWWLSHRNDTSISVLLDGSHGKGKSSDIIPLANIPKVGYAGGMGPDNIYGKTARLLCDPAVYDFWVDMESGVRTDGWFDVAKAEAVIEAVHKAESMER